MNAEMTLLAKKCKKVTNNHYTADLTNRRVRAHAREHTQACAQFVSHARFVVHAKLSISLLANDKIDYTLEYNGKLIINGLAVEMLRNQVTSPCC